MLHSNGEISRCLRSTERVRVDTVNVTVPATSSYSPLLSSPDTQNHSAASSFKSASVFEACGPALMPEIVITASRFPSRSTVGAKERLMMLLASENGDDCSTAPFQNCGTSTFRGSFPFGTPRSGNPVTTTAVLSRKKVPCAEIEMEGAVCRMFGFVMLKDTWLRVMRSKIRVWGFELG